MNANAERKKGLDDLGAQGRRVFVRVDFNVPLRDGAVSDDTRLTAALPTLERLAKSGARVVLASHLGRPKGKDPKQSLRPVAARLSELVGRPVAFADDCIGPSAESAVRALGEGQFLLLENLRFHPEEEANDPAFARALASLADCYVNDAFGSAHRAHASTEGIARLLKPAVAGLLMQRELDYLGRAIEHPTRPFVAILGGAKISGKIDVIRELLPKVDRLLIGGAMMFTFLRAQGRETGRSLVEADRVDLARELLAGDAAGKLLLPVDCLLTKDLESKAAGRAAAVTEIPADELGADIGPRSIRLFADELSGARTVLWNGPMGVFENPLFAEGTFAMARALAEATRRGAVTVVGGGDSAAAIHAAGLDDAVSHVSTGGGASLEFLEGKVLPGVAALDAKN